MSTPSKQLTVTAVTDGKSGIVTAFFNELPGLVVQSQSQDDVVDKLKSLLNSYINRLNSRKDHIYVNQKAVF